MEAEAGPIDTVRFEDDDNGDAHEGHDASHGDWPSRYLHDGTGDRYVEPPNKSRPQSTAYSEAAQSPETRGGDKGQLSNTVQSQSYSRAESPELELASSHFVPADSRCAFHFIMMVVVDVTAVHFILEGHAACD